MKKSVVKKSIFSRFLNMMLPFYCRGCGKVGSLLCERCRNDIEVMGEVPVLPERPNREGERVALEEQGGRASWREGEIDRLFVVGAREGALLKLVEDYKYKSIKNIAEILAEFLDEAMPKDLPGEIVIVPLPTVKKHIRERGFDHTRKLAEEFGKLRGLRAVSVLKRMNKTVQVGADEKTRKKQAEKAYAVDMRAAREAGLTEKAEEDKEEEELSEEITYLLLDDVWTTGASMRAAAKKLCERGAKKIYAAVICKNR